MWLIAVGVIFIGIALYYYAQNDREQRPTSVSKPTTPMAEYVLYGAGVALLGAAILLFLNVGKQTGWDAFAYFVISIGLLVAGVKAFKGGYNAHQKHALNMKSLADAHGSRVEYEKHDVALETVREEARMDALIRRARQQLEQASLRAQGFMMLADADTHIMRRQIERAELSLRAELLGDAKSKGVSIDQYMRLNEQWNNQLIDLRVREIEITQLVKFSLESQPDIIKQKSAQRLLQIAYELLATQQDIKRGSVPEDSKPVFLAAYEAVIEDITTQLTAHGLVTKKERNAIEELARSNADEGKLNGQVNETDAIEISAEKPRRGRRG